MTKNARRFAVVLPGLILTFCAVFSPLARAGEGGMEEVPEVNEGLEAVAPASVDLGAQDALSQGNIVEPQGPEITNVEALPDAPLETSAQPRTERTAQSSSRTQAQADRQATVRAEAQSEIPGRAALVPSSKTPATASQAAEVSNTPQAKEVAGADGEAISALSNGSLQDRVNAARSILEQVRTQWDKVIVGQDEAKSAITMALVAHGHVFFESAPGMGKTKLSETVARSIAANFKRVQGTPDLLPSDITGATVLKKKANGESELAFQPGPIFTDIFLLDEQNRMAPKTQSGILEGMEERHVTVQGETHKLSPYFTVLATQNPLEEQGVFPLPYATMDRYLFKIPISKPSVEDLARIRQINRDPSSMPKVQKAATLETLDQIRKVAVGLTLTPELGNYIDRIIAAANDRSELKAGHVISPRAAIGIEIAARIHALLRGSTWVSQDDVTAVAPLVLRHRLILNYDTEATPDMVVQKIIAEVKIGDAKPAK